MASSVEAQGRVQGGVQYPKSGLPSLLSAIWPRLVQKSVLIPLCWSNILRWKGCKRRAREEPLSAGLAALGGGGWAVQVCLPQVGACAQTSSYEGRALPGPFDEHLARLTATPGPGPELWAVCQRRVTLGQKASPGWPTPTFEEIHSVP